MSSISGGSWADCDWNGTFPNIPEGTYYVGWIIDATGAVSETDESNNTAYKEGYTLTVVSGDTDPPTVPSNVNAYTTGVTSVKVSWSASSDPGSGVKRYDVQRMKDGGSYTHVAYTSNTYYNDSGLEEETTYYYRVRAEDNAGNWSGWSSPAGVTTGGTITLSAAWDTYCDEANPDTNYTYENALLAGPQGSAGNNMDLLTLIRFSLPSKILGKTIDVAQLDMRIFVDRTSTLRAHRIASDWDGASVTWNTCPSWYTAVLDTGVKATVGGTEYLRFDIKAAVQDWADGETFYGILIKSDFNQGTSNEFWSFWSLNSGNGPTLLIKYY